MCSEMAENYEYEPPRGGGTLKAVVAAMLVVAAVMITAGAHSSYAGLIQLGGAMLAVTAITIGTRFCLTGYVYALCRNSHGVDLVITEIRGKKRRTVCRVAVDGGTLVRVRRGTPQPKGALYNYTTDPFSEDKYYFSSAESGVFSDGTGEFCKESVKFNPNDEFVSLMLAWGATLSANDAE